MSEKHKPDEIDRILEEFQKSKEARSKQQAPAAPQPAMPEPPQHKEAGAESAAHKKSAPTNQEKPTRAKKAQKKQKGKTALPPEAKKKRLKTLWIACGVILLAACAVFLAIHLQQSSANAYLKPFEEKYDIKFPPGILEEYCDVYGENQKAAGVLTYAQQQPVIVSKIKNTNMPYLDEDCDFLSFGFNTVIYATKAQLGDLETAYQTAEACNRSGCFLQYDTLFEKQQWRVVGALYTNTLPEDDNGYIFPYNVTQPMTADSYSIYFDRLSTRFLYDTQYTFTRNDKLLTLSVESDFHANFRFVLVCVLADTQKEIQAVENKRPHYPQVIYDENNAENPYALSGHWYPEIILEENKKTSKQNIKDYSR